MILYYIAILGVKLILRAFAIFSIKCRELLSGQRGVFQGIKQFAVHRNPELPCFWFHCASLGEFEQGRPLIEALRTRYPNAQIVLTFFSPSGYKVRRDYTVADLVSYLPFDGWRNAQQFVRLVRPTVAFFVKYEYWYGYLRALRRQGVPAVSVSTLLAPDHIAFRWYGGFYRRTMRLFTHYFAQDQRTADLLAKIGIDQTTIAGDTRFDRVAALASQAGEVELAARFKGNEPVFVAGSTWPPDHDALLPLVREFTDELKFIIAPHQIEEAELARIEEAIPYQVVRYSRAKLETVANYRVLLIDNVGMLTALYRYGDFAYVGGAFGKSLHNVLEPATFGMPIYFGNRSYRHVNEANSLLKLGGAFTVADSQELRLKFLMHHRNPEQRQRAASTTQQFVADHQGATASIVEYVSNQLLS
ncbi:MAG: glycosyltransferase N-terminal domain-containing protein [Tunicatimonas sp.]